MWITLTVSAVITIAVLIARRKPNKDQSAIFLIGMPLLLCMHCMVLADTANKTFLDPSTSKIVGIIVNIMLSFPVLIMLLVCLYRACRYPLANTNYPDTASYDRECVKRQRRLLRAVFPAARIAFLLAAISGTIAFLIVAALAVVSLHPGILFLTLITCGAALIIYFILAVGISSPFILLFTAFAVMAGLLIIETYMLGVTMLRRAKLGYSKVEYVKMAVSVLIPIWGFFTLAKVSRDLKERGMA